MMGLKTHYTLLRHAYRYWYDLYRWSKEAEQCEDCDYGESICDSHWKSLNRLSRDETGVDEFEDRPWQPKRVK